MIGLKILKNKLKIKSLVPEGEFFNHLRPKGEILIKKDEDFDIICFEIHVMVFFPAIVHLWPINRHVKFTPVWTENSLDSGIDTLH